MINKKNTNFNKLGRKMTYTGKEVTKLINGERIRYTYTHKNVRGKNNPDDGYYLSRKTVLGERFGNCKETITYNENKEIETHRKWITDKNGKRRCTIHRGFTSFGFGGL